MKNRKRVIVAFMLVACMLLGVGYAAITTHLNIQGGVEVPVLTLMPEATWSGEAASAEQSVETKPYFFLSKR